MEPGQQVAQSLQQLNQLASNPPPAPPQQGSAVQALLPSPGNLVAPEPASPTTGLGQAYSGGTPEGSLTSNPRQATADTLNILSNKGELEGKQGEIQSKEQSELAAKQNEAAQEKILQSQDFQNHLVKSNDKYETEHQQHQAAYDEFRKKAGSLKDPGSQFWEDKGQTSRITAALAAFSSGLGGGLTGHGNQFMDFLQKQIDNNFNARKQNIEDLYQSSVEAGKIADSTENHNRFMNEAKLKSYDLASMHIQHELEAIKNGASSQIAKVLASKAQAGLEQEGVNARSALAAYEAKQAAAAGAAQRERMKELRANYTKFVELHNNKDMGEDEARNAAFKDLQGLGYNQSELASVAGGLGITANPATGKYEVPKSAEGTTEPIHYDESGKLIIPTKSATGKLITSEEQEKMRKDAQERSATIDGKKYIFNRKDDAEAASVIPEANRLHDVMMKAWKEGDAGTYTQARKQFIELAPKLLGYKRGPSIPQAGESTKSESQIDAEADADRGTIAGQLPEFHVAHIPLTGIPIPQKAQAYANKNPLGMTNTESGQAINKLAGVKTTLDAIKKDALSNTINPPAEQKQENKPMTTQQLDDLTKQLGGK